MTFSCHMKLINDAVHGYIEIPEDYCYQLVDTDIFQRLRRIEQSSIRSIFPCAGHDRFIHSLGTYHLGRKAVNFIFRAFNDEVLNSLGNDKITTLRKTFEIACLLHDCGHAPFSHTLEYLYAKANNLDELILSSATNREQLGVDMANISPKEHEKVSAYLVLRYYKDRIAIIDKNIDVDLVARMIIGCKYTEHDAPLVQIMNALIGLLNGKAIDVDKLDYAARDRWASGYNSSTVDLERLLSAFRIQIREGKYTFCIHKSALSEIDGVLDSRNFQSVWIFSHQKVVYDQYILDKAINSMAKKIDPKKPNRALEKLFNVEMFFSPQKIHNEMIYQLSDDDLVHLLKKYSHDNPYAKEWFSRQHVLKPVWKSHAEYYSLIAGSSSQIDMPDHLERTANEAIKKFLNKHGLNEGDYLLQVITPKITSIGRNELFITINDTLESYSNLGLPDKYGDKIKPFVYLYIRSNHHQTLKEEIVLLLKDTLTS